MRSKLLLTGLAAVSLAAWSASAQETGRHGEDLRRILATAATGTCSTELMAGGLLENCQQQIRMMGPAINSFGPVDTVTFVRIQQTPNGPVEVYQVKFTSLTLTWAIGGRQDDGRYTIAYSMPSDA